MPPGKRADIPEVPGDMLVECFTVQAAAFPMSGLAFSDAIPTAVILGNPNGMATFRSGGREQVVVHAWLSAQYLENVRIQLDDPGDELLAIRFNPLYFNDISNIPARLLRNGLVWSLQDILGGNSGIMLTDIARQCDVPGKLDVLSHLLTRNARHHAANHLLQEAIQLIKINKGNVQIEQLAISLNVSYKWLERNFLQLTGVSPKEFARQQRFLHTYFDILNQPEKDLLEIALNNAFYDQNHLSKEFKKFTGYSPAWFRKHHGLSQNERYWSGKVKKAPESQ
ncbi:AraC-type DNA-binding protein [Dyadobacter soli]|uniref:AraC-type DNA-binding protein n=2 Tax=Dyadobacter soli TaxID=659014 RepID=A0A1G6VXL3_9BACT|nr:AraC-type DNA-binding protein [Dyadobacter soli]